MDLEFLANHLLNLTKVNSKRWIIGIVGIPSSGKSYVAERLKDAVNSMAKQSICEYIGMDGFHFTREYLDNMDNPQLAHQKRGAHWTFDCDAFSKLLRSISMDTKNDIIAPTFDHKLKDPSPNGTVIKAKHRIVIVEGLYLFLDILLWKQMISPYFDEKWLLHCDWKLAEKRIIQRHVRSGIAANERDALFRWEDNDKPNGQFLLKHLDMSQLHVIMDAVDDGVRVRNIRWKQRPKM